MSSSPTPTPWPLSAVQRELVDKLFSFPEEVRIHDSDNEHNTFLRAFVERVEGNDMDGKLVKVSGGAEARLTNGPVKRAFTMLVSKYEQHWTAYVEEMFEHGEDESDSEEEEGEEQADGKASAPEHAMWNDADLVAKWNFTAFALVMNSSGHVLDAGSSGAKLMEHPFSNEEVQLIAQNAERAMQVSPAVMQMVVAGECDDVPTVLAAEGQLARLVYQSRSEMELLAFLECWLCVIAQLVEPEAMSNLKDLYVEIANDAVEKYGCAPNDSTEVSRYLREEWLKVVRKLVRALVDGARGTIAEYVYSLTAQHKKELTAEMLGGE
jgi:hypothetical protein